MMRVVLFICVNLSVMVLFGVVISILCFSSTDVFILICIAGIFGLGGAFFSLFFSKIIALSSVNGRIINVSSNNMESWLLEILRDQSKQLNIITPQLAIYNTQDVNAFATGFRQNDALVAISTGLLESMTKESIEAVIAHEVNHIASGDMITMTLIQGIINTFVIFISRRLAQIISFWMSYVNTSEYEDLERNDCHDYNQNSCFLYIIISTILELLFGGLASIIVFWFSRHREFYADAGASKLVGREKMIFALQELKNHSDRVMIAHEALSTLCIHHYSRHLMMKTIVGGEDLFSSHPSLDRRIEALKYGTYLNKSFNIF